MKMNIIDFVIFTRGQFLISRWKMASSSNASFQGIPDFSFGSSPESNPVDVDLPDFQVLLRRHWVGKIVEMKNALGICIADGILRNIRSSDVSGQTVPLGETHVAIQVSKTFVDEEAPDEWRYCVKA